MSHVIGLLKKSELFAGLPDEKIEQVLAIGHSRRLQAGEFVIRENDPSDELYVVENGMVEVLVVGVTLSDVPGSPDLTPVVQLGRGQVFGEMALVDRGARSATVRCVEEGTTLFIVPRTAFWELCEQDHHIGFVVMRNIARDLSFKLRHRNLPRSVLV